MAIDSHKPLSLQEAKEQLRAAGHRLSPTCWLQRHPWQILTLALSFGLLAGDRRKPGMAARLVLQQFVPVMFSAMLGRKTS